MPPTLEPGTTFTVHFNAVQLTCPTAVNSGQEQFQTIVVVVVKKKQKKKKTVMLERYLERIWICAIQTPFE